MALPSTQMTLPFGGEVGILLLDTNSLPHLFVKPFICEENARSSVLMIDFRSLIFVSLAFSMKDQVFIFTWYKIFMQFFISSSVKTYNFSVEDSPNLIFGIFCNEFTAGINSL